MFLERNDQKDEKFSYEKFREIIGQNSPVTPKVKDRLRPTKSEYI